MFKIFGKSWRKFFLWKERFEKLFENSKNILKYVGCYKSRVPIGGKNRKMITLKKIKILFFIANIIFQHNHLDGSSIYCTSIRAFVSRSSACPSSFEKRLRVNNSASASDEECYPLKTPIRAGNNAKSDGTRSVEYGGGRVLEMSHLNFFKSPPPP